MSAARRKAVKKIQNTRILWLAAKRRKMNFSFHTISDNIVVFDGRKKISECCKKYSWIINLIYPSPNLFFLLSEAAPFVRMRQHERFDFFLYFMYIIRRFSCISHNWWWFCRFLKERHRKYLKESKHNFFGKLKQVWKG